MVNLNKYPKAVLIRWIEIFAPQQPRKRDLDQLHRLYKHDRGITKAERLLAELDDKYPNPTTKPEDDA